MPDLVDEPSKSITRDLLTGRDGISHDLGRYSWAGSFIVVTIVILVKLWRSDELDLLVIAQTYGAIALAHAGALFAKMKTEPGQ